MCSACGVLSGTPDWMERAGNPDGIGAEANETRRAERQRLLKMVNTLLAPGRTKVRDFGEKLEIKSATGKSRMVDSLGHIWITADVIGLRKVDPLDEQYLELIAAEAEKNKRN